MRQADGSDLLGANDARNASIGIIYVAPGDDRPSVLEAILMQDKLGRKQVAVVLPENSRAFQRPVDFDGLKNMRRGLKTEIIFVASGVPGPAEFARQRRFTVYTSLDSYTSALRAESPDNGNAKKGLLPFNRKPKLVPNANAPAPLESFEEPASSSLPPPPLPLVAPIMPVSALPPIAAVPFDDEASTWDEPPPGEPSHASSGADMMDAGGVADNEWAKPSAASQSQQDAGAYFAPGVPMPEDEDVKPVRQRSKTGPIPIAIALPQTGAATKPLSPGAKGANGTASPPAKSGNTGKQAAIGAGAVGVGAAAAFAATSRAPVAGGGQPPIRGNTSGTGGGGGGGSSRRRSTRQLLAILLVLLTLLLLAGIAFASPMGQGLLGNITGSTVKATVTITPDHRTISDSFVVPALIGKYDPTAQVQARILSYTSPSQSASANATGSIQGRQASGSLTFLNNNASSVTFSSKVLTGASGVPVTFNGPITVPANPPFLTVTGFAVNEGPNGDIPALDIVGSCCAAGITVKNTTSFSGGQSPQPNSVITQNDINMASNNLIATLKPSAQTALQQQVQANEQVVSGSLKCTTNVTANHRVGDQAKSVTVTGKATCTEEVYDQKAAFGIASTALKAEAAKNPGPAYILVGNVVTSITSATVVDAKNTVSLVILAQGEWVYNFTDTILTSIKNKIAKESQSAAQADLKKWPGVLSATVSISSGTTMPDAANITINVVKIPGLTGSPTPGIGSPTTTPSGTTPTSSPAITPTTGLGGQPPTPTVLGGS